MTLTAQMLPGRCTEGSGRAAVATSLTCRPASDDCAPALAGLRLPPWAQADPEQGRLRRAREGGCGGGDGNRVF